MAMKYASKWFYLGGDKQSAYRRMRIGGAGVNGKWQWFSLAVDSGRITQLGRDGCEHLNNCVTRGLLSPSEISTQLPRSRFNGNLFNEVPADVTR